MNNSIVKASFASAAAIAAGSGAAVANDFNGWYAGLSLGADWGDAPIYLGDSYPYELNGDIIFGGFVGYMADGPNNLKMGVELAFHTAGEASDVEGTSTSYPDEYQAQNIDVKFRVGTVLDGGGSLGNTLVYGFFGVSGADMSTAASSGYGTAFGFNYGVGADFGVTENFTVGLELIGRTLDGYAYDTGGSSVRQSQYGLYLRGAFHF